MHCAVIGAGYFGRLHAQKYANLPDCNLYAVADINIETAQEVASPYGCKAVSDYSSLLGKVDAVSVVVPTINHYKIANDFLQNGTHVLVEKPMTKTLKEADKLIETAKAHQRILQVGHIERFNPALHQLKEAIFEDSFIRSSRLVPFPKRNNDVCVVLDLMIHDLDIVMSLAKSGISYISTKGMKVLTNEIDIANARLEFKNGCIADLSVSRISDKRERKLNIFTINKYYSIEVAENISKTLWKDDMGRKVRSKIKHYPKTDMLLEEIRHFTQCIRDNTQVMVDGEVGRHILATAIQISEKLNSA